MISADFPAIQSLDGHTFLTPPDGSRILDAGCRGFAFAAPLAASGFEVIGCDPDVAIAPGGFTCVPAALVGADMAGKAAGQRLLFARWGDGAGNHLSDLGRSLSGPAQPDLEGVEAVTLPGLIKRFGFFSVVKLDIEGAELGVLEDVCRLRPRLRPWCLSVEFHCHCFRDHTRQRVDALVARLEKHYRIQQHDWTRGRCGIENYWDSVFVRRPTAELTP